MHRRLLAIVLWSVCSLAVAGYDADSKRASNLSGTWALNASLSDDPERMLEQRLAKERERYEQARRRWEASQRLPGIPSDDADVEDDRPPPSAGRRPERRPWQKQRDENLRRMLGVSNTLTVRQQGTQFEIISAVDSRRVQAGSHTQVSMPEGELADSNVGWDGEWFVIERRVRQGPRALEKLRLLKKTDQLEYYMAWSGDTELSGMKVRRIYDRVVGQAAPPDPRSGPVR